MVDLVIGVIVIFIVVCIGILRLLWFLLTEIFQFSENVIDSLRAPSPERKLENVAVQGSKEIHETTEKYRHQVKDILEES